MSTRSKRLSSTQDSEESAPRARRRPRSTQEDVDEKEFEEVDEMFAFSQQAPEASQNILVEKGYERQNLQEMDATARETLLLKLSRTVLFKALDREPLDRARIAKDLGLTNVKIAGAAFQEARQRLNNVFGFDLTGVPKTTMKKLPEKYQRRYYVTNQIQDFPNGSHSKAIHSIHTAAAVEKGFMILVLALIFCKGAALPDGSRWILARDLYRLLHDVDDALPEEPPAQGTKRAKDSTAHGASTVSTGDAPNPDALLESLVNWDYLRREKATEDNFPLAEQVEEGDVIFTMGPRAALEVGRKQIIYFCAEILDEEPDPSMLAEVEHDDEQRDNVDDGGFMEPLPTATMTQE